MHKHKKRLYVFIHAVLSIHPKFRLVDITPYHSAAELWILIGVDSFLLHRSVLEYSNLIGQNVCFIYFLNTELGQYFRL